MNPIVKIIQPHGILDGTKAGEFKEEIQNSLNTRAELILVDLQNVTFMDSSGLGALVICWKNVEAAGAKLFICGLNEQLKILFELTSMDQKFTIFSNRQEFEDKILKL